MSGSLAAIQLRARIAGLRGMAALTTKPDCLCPAYVHIVRDACMDTAMTAVNHEVAASGRCMHCRAAHRVHGSLLACSKEALSLLLLALERHALDALRVIHKTQLLVQTNNLQAHDSAAHTQVYKKES